MPRSPNHRRSNSRQRGKRGYRQGHKESQEKNYGGEARKKIHRNDYYEDDGREGRERSRRGHDDDRHKRRQSHEERANISIVQAGRRKSLQPESQIKVHFRFRPIKVKLQADHEQKIMKLLLDHVSKRKWKVERFEKSPASRPGFLQIEFGFKYDSDAYAYFKDKSSEIDLTINQEKINITAEPTKVFKFLIDEFEEQKKKIGKSRSQSQGQERRKDTKERLKKSSKKRRDSSSLSQSQSSSGSSSSSKSKRSSRRKEDRREQSRRRNRTQYKGDKDRSKERERQREREKEKQRQKERQREKQREREKEREKGKDKQRERQKQKEKQKERERERRRSNEDVPSRKQSKFDSTNNANPPPQLSIPQTRCSKQPGRSSQKQSSSRQYKTLYFFGVYYSANLKDMNSLFYQHQKGPFKHQQLVMRRMKGSICQYIQGRFEQKDAIRLLQISDRLQVRGQPLIVFQSESGEQQQLRLRLSQFQLNMQFPSPIEPYYLLKWMKRSNVRVVQIVTLNKLTQLGTSEYFNITFNSMRVCELFKMAKHKEVMVQEVTIDNVINVYRPNFKTQLVLDNTTYAQNKIYDNQTMLKTNKTGENKERHMNNGNGYHHRYQNDY